MLAIVRAAGKERREAFFLRRADCQLGPLRAKSILDWVSATVKVYVMRALFFLIALAFASTAQAHSIEDLNWMKGCWRTEAARQEITEVWTAPPAPVMLGTAVTRREGNTVFWEQLRIEERDGALALIAMPGGAAPVRFEMTEVGEDHVVFENPAHDYPKRIVYSRMGRMLTATVSGLSHVLGEAYAYRRISCPRAFLP